MRRGAVLLVTLGVAALLTACGGDEPASQADAAPADEAEATETDAAFPVTIEHRWGSTTFDAAPERIVTVGLTDQDPLLALGVAPVGTTEWFGGHPSAVWPWAQDELEATGAEPEVIGETGEISYERIAAMEPDAILAVYAGLTEEEYDLLSDIAPTVAQSGEHTDWGVSWQEQTRTIGKIVGRSAEAEALVEEIDGRFAELRKAHPELVGAMGLVATPYDGTIWAYAPEDLRGRFMAALGMEQPAEIAEIAGEEYGAELSLERTDLLDVDALVWILDDPVANREALVTEPLYNQLAVHTEGRDVFVGTYDMLGAATSFVTVLSLPMLLDELVPMILAAVDGDPATEVPAA